MLTKAKQHSNTVCTAIVILMMAPCVTSLNAQEQGNSFSLKQAVEYALKNSPSAKNAELDMESAIHQKKEIAGTGYPQISASADLKNYIEIPTSLIPGDFVGMPGTFLPVKFGTKYNATAGFSASQLIFSSDYIFALKASTEFLSLSKIGQEMTQTEIAAAVSKAYYTLLISRDRLKLLDINLVRLKKMLDDIKAMNEQGLVEVIDVERLEVQHNNLLVQKEQTVKLVGLSETNLKFQMGFDLDKPLELTDSLTFSETEFEELAIGKLDFTKRPEYRLQQTQLRLNEIDKKRYQWGYLPTLAAYGSYQWNTQRQQTDFFDFDKNNPLKQWYKIGLIGATLNFNIFDGFQRHHKIQRAKIKFQKSQNEQRKLELAFQLESTVSAITYNNAYSALLVQRKNMELARHVHEVSQKKYENGVGSNLEVVNAEADLQQAEINYYNAVYDMLIAKIDYQKSIGALK